MLKLNKHRMEKGNENFSIPDETLNAGPNVNTSGKNTVDLSRGYSIEDLLAKPSANSLNNKVWDYRSKSLYYSFCNNKSCAKTECQPSLLHFAQSDDTPTIQDRTSGKAMVEKRIRTSFTNNQLFKLEEQFAIRQYMVGKEREYFARRLGLEDVQVKIWFQNRRTKWRKQQREFGKQFLVQKPKETDRHNI